MASYFTFVLIWQAAPPRPCGHITILEGTQKIIYHPCGFPKSHDILHKLVCTYDKNQKSSVNMVAATCTPRNLRCRGLQGLQFEVALTDCMQMHVKFDQWHVVS